MLNLLYLTYLLFFGFEHSQSAFSVFNRTFEETIDLTVEPAGHRRRAVVNVASFCVTDVLTRTHRGCVESTTMKAQRGVLIGGQQTADYHTTERNATVATEWKLSYLPQVIYVSEFERERTGSAITSDVGQYSVICTITMQYSVVFAGVRCKLCYKQHTTPSTKPHGTDLAYRDSEVPVIGRDSAVCIYCV